MPDDQNGNDDLGSGSGRGRGPGGGKQGNGPRRNLRGNWQNRVGGKPGDTEGLAPALPLSQPIPVGLPLGTSHQVELLLAGRQHRLRRLLLRFFVFVFLPTLVVWFYTALIETPRYVCNYEVTYQSYQPGSTLSGGLTQSMFGSSVADSIDYGTLITQFIQSSALAEQVDQQLHLRQAFSSKKIDWFSRLKKDASQKKFLAAWSDHVSVSEGFGGYLTIIVQGFDPAQTLLLAHTITADADAMMDKLSSPPNTAAVKSASDQLALAATALKKSDDALTGFRNSHVDLDPNLMSTQLATIVGTLESQLATLRAQLQQAQANMKPGAAQIVQLQLQVNAVEKQIQAERQRLSSNNGQSTYSNTVAQYEDLVSDQAFANTTYQSAQQGLVIARANAASKENYIVDFVPPILPDHPTMPNPLTSSFTVFMGCLFGYGIVNLLLTAFRDQSGL